MSGIQRINAVFIYVNDMKTMRDFYESVLGLKSPIVETELWVEYELPGAHLALHQGDAYVLQQADAKKNTVKFSLEIDDIQTYCDRLHVKGTQFSFLPRRDFNSWLAEIKDPEGNLIRLIQYDEK